MEMNYIYPIRSSFVDFEDGTCSVACWYADKSFEVKQYSANHITEIEIDENNHCAFFTVDYVSHVFLASGLPLRCIEDIVNFALVNKITLIEDDREE